MILAQTTTTTTDPTGGAAAAAIAGMGLVGGLIVLAFVVFGIICYCLIAKKAGYNPLLGILMLVPLVNFIIGLIFVFTEWPVSAENKRLRAQLGLPPHGPLQPAPTGYAPPGYPATPGPGPITPA